MEMDVDHTGHDQHLLGDDLFTCGGQGAGGRDKCNLVSVKSDIGGKDAINRYDGAAFDGDI